MLKGIGTMANYDSVNTILNFFFNSLGQSNVLLRTHVLAKNSKNFFGFKITNAGQFRNSAIKFTW